MAPAKLNIGKLDVGHPLLGGITVWEGEREFCEVPIHCHDEKTALDKARLIAAAPDMLEALESLVANLADGDFISATRIDAARTAIAKARGQ